MASRRSSTRLRRWGRKLSSRHPFLAHHFSAPLKSGAFSFDSFKISSSSNPVGSILQKRIKYSPAKLSPNS
jgi:hypothetical protein